MTPERMTLLAGRYAPPRDVVSYTETSSGSILTLACGHTKTIAPHFDCSIVEQTACFYCGEAFVRDRNID